MTHRYRISHAARNDILDILAWSHDQFGELARQRYERLIATAIRDLAVDPTRTGSRSRAELGDGVRTWHLRHSRHRAAPGVVRRPRRLVVYRIDDDLVWSVGCFTKPWTCDDTLWTSNPHRRRPLARSNAIHVTVSDRQR